MHVADGPIQRHQDYDLNFAQAEKLIENTALRWPKGMKIMVSGEDKASKTAVLVFSCQRMELAGTWAMPLTFHMSNRIFKKQVESSYRFYHAMALEKQKEIDALPKSAKEGHLEALQSHNDDWTGLDTSESQVSTNSKQMALAAILDQGSRSLPRNDSGQIIMRY